MPRSSGRVQALNLAPVMKIWCLTLFALLLLGLGNARAAQVTLAWDMESGAAGYKIYYGTSSDAYTTSVDVGDVTNYSMSLADGNTYYLVATAYDASRLESDFSEEISYTAGASACSYSLSSTGANFNATGGSGTISVTTQAGCTWSASTGVSWATITAGATGTGSGTVSYTVAANTGTSRTAASSIAGQTFTFNQAAAASYTLSASAGTGGSISPAGSVSVAGGTNKSFTISPNSGYAVANVTVDGTSVGAVTSYTFTNVAANHTITATFAATTTKKYTMTASAANGGSITPAGKSSVAAGSSMTYTITPKSGYRIKYLVVDNKQISAASSYTFSSVSTAHSIKAYFGVAQVASVDHTY